MNPVCQHTGRDELKKLGLFARDIRRDRGAGSPEYRAAIAEIDREVERLRATQPSLFWNEDSPEYRAMSARWLSERRARSKKAFHEPPNN